MGKKKKLDNGIKTTTTKKCMRQSSKDTTRLNMWTIRTKFKTTATKGSGFVLGYLPTRNWRDWEFQGKDPEEPHYCLPWRLPGEQPAWLGWGRPGCRLLKKACSSPKEPCQLRARHLTFSVWSNMVRKWGDKRPRLQTCLIRWQAPNRADRQQPESACGGQGFERQTKTGVRGTGNHTTWLRRFSLLKEKNRENCKQKDKNVMIF